ncbi:MAG: hypothetical protein WC208_08415 [Gallionella sp.]|jgi:hypothetical protein
MSLAIMVLIEKCSENEKRIAKALEERDGLTLIGAGVIQYEIEECQRAIKILAREENMCKSAPSSKVEVLFKAMEYQVSDGNLSINVKIDNQNKITLTTRKGGREFLFLGSNKDMVRRIGELIVKASTLAIHPIETGPFA